MKFMIRELMVIIMALIGSISVSQGAGLPDSKPKVPTNVISDSQVIFPEERASELLEQCSRTAPKADTFWTPSREDIARLEKLLPDYVKVNSPRYCSNLYNKLTEYRFQYGGIVVNGRKLIYVNAFHVNIGGETWRTEFIGICDGACNAWGVEFDVESEIFSDINANGDA
jgi:hypothetical protein